MNSVQQIREYMLNKANSILDKKPLDVNELSFFSIDIIMELDSMANEGNIKALELKQKIIKINTTLKQKTNKK